MPRSLSLSDDAIADLAAIRAWQLQRGSGPAAKRRVQMILQAIRVLSQAPCLYGAGMSSGTREFSVAGHRVVYAVAPDTGRDTTSGDVTVLRIFGPGQSRA